MEARVSSRFDVLDGHTIAGYQDSGTYRGYDGIKAALQMAPNQVTDLVKDATVLGRGGAGFPAGVKWGFCPPGVWPRYIVVNGDESEPGTYKDRVLMERDPHQLIEGCLIAAYAIGAAQVFLYVRGEMPHAQERIAAALNEAYAANLVGKNILGTDFSVDIILTWGAGAYIVGEETALIESLEGNRGMPRLKPPFFPAAKGLYMQPTIVNNVETLSNLPWLFCHSVDEYRSIGTETSPGTRLVALSGHVNNPGVFEIPQGTTTYRELFESEQYGGGIRNGHELKMFIPGGASAPWFFQEQVDLPLEGRPVGAAGSMLGSGAIVVMDETTDAVRACLRVVRFFARESCGKCTPCREGTTWEEKILQRIYDGYGRPSDIDLLLDVADNISPGPYPVAADPNQGLDAVPFPPKQTTICPLGPSSVAPITSAIRRFRHEFEAKITLRDRIPVSVGAFHFDEPADEPVAGAALTDEPTVAAPDASPAADAPTAAPVAGTFDGAAAAPVADPAATAPAAAGQVAGRFDVGGGGSVGQPASRHESAATPSVIVEPVADGFTAEASVADADVDASDADATDVGATDVDTTDVDTTDSDDADVPTVAEADGNDDKGQAGPPVSGSGGRFDV